MKICFLSSSNVSSTSATQQTKESASQQQSQEQVQDAVFQLKKKKGRTTAVHFSLMLHVWMTIFSIRNVPSQHFLPASLDCKSRYVHCGCWKPPMIFTRMRRKYTEETKQTHKQKQNNKVIPLSGLLKKKASKSLYLYFCFN